MTPSAVRPGASPADIFTPDQLEAHAAHIAATHTVAAYPRRGRPLLPKLDRSSARLDAAYLFLSAAARSDAQPVGSEDWLRDNHHVVQDQVREIRQHLPRKYYVELPKLADGPFEGYPRVYLLARELIAHTAGRIDLDTAAEFAGAYQRTSELTIGETWAIPIMLRLGLIEELHRLADGVVDARRDREKARAWHRRLAEAAGWDAATIAQMLDNGRQEDGRISAAFVVELLQWLRDQPLTAAPTWQALHHALEAQDDSADEMLRLEHQREAADQLAIGNVITSMRLVSSIDWTLFFERVSVVERILREDPSGAYALMDFPTRDRYRHAVEGLAKRARRSEPSVARAVVALAATAVREDPAHDRRHHVGYYLISRGRFHLEPEVGYRPTIRERISRFTFKHPVLGYLGTIGGLTGLAVASLLTYSTRHGATGLELWLVAALVLIPVSELVIHVVHLVVTAQIPPRPLPKLALRDGVPPVHRTMVVVPAIVDSPARVAALVDDLEVRFLGNREENLHFGLLTDFRDADEASRPEDETILEHARVGVDTLNQRYGATRFFLFHRARRWNASEARWMGWERKRGKLVEFNRLLRGATDTSFIAAHGDLSVLPSIRFVITLDSDTQLPMEAASRLIGTLAHPLNLPRFDPAAGRVTEGYGVLQPAVGVDLVSANRTVFAKLFSGHVGVDPYTTAVSDVYQDLFHEGSYVGKGIYDVDAFEAALANRVPENRLLSHDLFEGSYARAGLCTDISLVDEYPPHYLAFAARQHRWARGDWQIARWLWRTVPDANGRRLRNTLPVIARWKILDNLRRSLLAPSLMALLLAGWTILPGSALLWTGLGLLVLAFPAYAQLGRSLSSRVRGVPLGLHVAAERDNVVTSARQSLLWASFLPHQAWLMVDAITRTLWRLLVTRRHLLEWVSADRLAGVKLTPATVVRSMWAAPALAIGTAALVAAVAPARLPLALPLILLWLISPGIAYAVGRPMLDGRQAIDDADRAALRKVARRTWLFFEDLLTPADHWLVPDNYQEDRDDTIAHRTSPTNIGLQLLSTFAAFDFGYLSASGVVDRLEPMFATLLRLPRYRGHFYNWYDTRTLAPLIPTYVSSVDSGNLAGYLLTVKIGLQQLAEGPLIDGRALDGMRDAVRLCEDCLANASQTTGAGSGRTLKREIAELSGALEERPDAPEAWNALLARIEDQLATVGVLLHELEDAATASDESEPLAEAGLWLERVGIAVAQRRADLVRTDTEAAELLDRAARLAGLADDIVEEMEFEFLFDRQRGLFSIGYNVTDGRLDSSFYDALASEARLASFVAIATGQIPHEHWFKLNRALTPSGGARALLSWSASMFEYFMPLLVMRAYPGTLLAETYRAVIDRQIQYGARNRVPWGISESAYNTQDLDRNYQYRGFGVPGLGLKRGLAEDLVVAPYASLLATPLVPTDVLRNLERLARLGMSGRYGFYEAIDFTPGRVPEGPARGVVLPTFMAHHQGMILVAIDNALHDFPMQRRFHDDPRVQAADLLLQERIPHQVPLRNPPIEVADHVPSVRAATGGIARVYTTPHTLSPRPHLLSNGSYVVMLTNAGGGYSRRQQTALTRWREDVTTDAWGSFCFVRDLDSREFWSTAYLPTGQEPDDYECTFAPDRVIYRRVDAGIETRTEIVVSPEDDAELRRVSVTNLGSSTRRLDLTSYAEIVLAPWDADLSHPAFSNLFIQTSSVPERDALMAVRRPRSGDDRRYLVHVLSGRGRGAAMTQVETDRARFLGRGGTIDRPLALTSKAPLSNTTGAVLDPIMSLRHAVRLAPGATARITFATAYADTEEAALLMIAKYHDRRAIARAVALASTHSQIELRHLGLTIDDTIAFQRLGGRLLSGDTRLRDVEAGEQNRCGQRDLWKYGISGDLPILVVRLTDETGVPLVADLLKAHEYLRIKGLLFDLVILNEHAVSYLQSLQEEILRLIESGPEQAWLDKPGGVFARRADLMPPDDQLLLRAAARVTMDAADGGLRSQLTRPHAPFVPGPTRTLISNPEAPVASAAPTRLPAPEPALELFNGSGGFAADGREYLVRVGADGVLPPVPWTNVVAHETFGFACTESGPGYTWSQNSHDNRLTPWRNDPVGDPPGEAVFIRDEESGAFWSATPLPAGGGQRYNARHGHGYSIYEHARDGVASELTLFVPGGQPVKIFRMTLKNTAGVRRRLTVTLYAEWVLGENRSRSAIHLVTGTEPETGAVTAVNRFRQEFPERVAFLDLTCAPGASRTFTGDRTEFIGRNGTLRRPAALGRHVLSNRVGSPHDPCGAIRVPVTLGPSEERVVIGLLGDATDTAQVRALVERYRDIDAVDAALRDARGFWDRVLDTITVRTPDRAMDLMLNRWLLYQTLACRIWGRSAFYQSSGAFGFRDQLQDTLALLAAAPAIARAHLLHAASRQFVEGDVQHWWHEPGGQGVRTRFSDDRLWLPYAALHYVGATGDAAVLDEPVPFLAGRVLDPDEHEAYEQPAVSPEQASLYDHCVRAIEVSLGTGAHGLPLMGTGDWNDGMSLVGAGGKGESVWLGWFLISILRPFAALVQTRGDAARATRYRRTATKLAKAVEQAWDGEWYRRAYFDDGTPLGSKENAECQIDAIAQSWSVISGAADPERARQAMSAVNERLVRENDGLVLLLTPPFDRMEPSPGYIRGYLPGVRENGGQYTHAALWNVLAFAQLGDGDRAWELFSLLNPVNHGRTPEEVARYRAEPYVVAADVYSVSPHTGRGGWTWYTGSAGWMYRVGIEAILGVTLRAGRLHIDPCIPRGWPGFEVLFTAGGAKYRITVENPNGVSRGVKAMELDGKQTTGRDIPILRDGDEHSVRVVLG
ncbi:MAG TPA: glucoamylase family protein [Vicinamibacterales bacterium]|nr:glucoamylase family protein [Vicinamibacterales bacterium]